MSKAVCLILTLRVLKVILYIANAAKFRIKNIKLQNFRIIKILTSPKFNFFLKNGYI